LFEVSFRSPLLPSLTERPCGGLCSPYHHFTTYHARGHQSLPHTVLERAGPRVRYHGSMQHHCQPNNGRLQTCLINTRDATALSTPSRHGAEVALPYSSTLPVFVNAANQQHTEVEAIVKLQRPSIPATEITRSQPASRASVGPSATMHHKKISIANHDVYTHRTRQYRRSHTTWRHKSPATLIHRHHSPTQPPQSGLVTLCTPALSD
jgi:hypothetical protein